MFSRRIIRGLVAALCFVSLGTIAAKAADAVDNRPELRIAVQQNPTSQETVDNASNVAFRNNYSINETLLTLDYRGDSTVKPNLGASWQWVSPTVLEMKLRPDVKFSDGTPMTADDVAFSFGPQRLTDPSAPGYPVYLTTFTSLDHVDVVDPLTVRFVTKFQDPIFVQRLASYYAGVISKNAWLKTNDWNKWRQMPVTPGPYKVVSYTANDQVVLAPNDYYFKGKPTAKQITFKIVPEVSSRIAGLLAGDYDIATDLPPDQLSVIDKAKGFSVRGGPVPNIRFLFLDKTAPVLQDPRIRQALSLAVDRQAIVDSIWDGRTIVPNGLQFPLYGPMYLKDYQSIKYDPDEAQRLLKEAGYKGEPIEIRSQNNYYTAENDVSQAVVAMWQAVGINAKLTFVEPGKLFNAAPGRTTGNWSSTGIIPDPFISMYTQFGSAGSMTQFDMWKNADFDAIGGQMEKETDITKRAALFRQLLDILLWKDPGVIVLHQNAVFFGVRDGINWQPMPAFFMDLGPDNLSFASSKQ